MSNVISRYFKTSSGNAFSSDSSMVSLEVNKIIVNVNTGERFKKISSNVFDKEGEEISDATTTSKGIMQVGTDLTVTDGVVSVADNFLRTNTTQNLTNTQANRALSNLGIEHLKGNNNAQKYCSRLTIGNTQILYGKSTKTWYDSSTSCRYCSAMFAYPFIAIPLVLGTPFITTGDDNAACGVVGYSYSPRTILFGIGSPDHVSRVFYGAIGQSFPLDENAFVYTEVTPGQGWCYIQIPKENINLTSSTCYFLVDMFISSNAPGSDYIEFVGSRAEEELGVGKSRISNTSGFDSGHFTLGYDLDLSDNPDSTHDDVGFMGYKDVSDRKLFTDPRFRTFKMASFIVSVPSSSISGDSFPYLDFTFNRSLSNGVDCHIRVFYIHS